MESVLPGLSDAFDAHLFAVNHQGARVARDGYAIRGNELLGDRFGRDQLPGLLNELQPDVVLVHHDTTFFAIHRPALDAYGAARVVVYCPLDWPELPPGAAQALPGADALVAYTRHGARVLERGLGPGPPQRAVVPHGVDPDRFAPVDRAEARERLGLERDAFIVLNANANVRRKRIDLTLRGFAAFARDRPAARLYLHTGLHGACDVRALAEELGVADRLLTTPHDGHWPQVTDEHLALIYNACDVGLNTAAAEGWGLVAFEHAATGAAQVVPDHGAPAELWRGEALLAGGDAADVASALARLHDDPAECAHLAERARALATSPRFRWPAIARRWEAVLRG